MSQQPLPAAFSLYLDLLRITAAISVLLHHLWPLMAPGHPLPWPGHEAVVLFFVLSGFVISHVSQRPSEDLRNYAVHRSARILSVALPALLLGWLLAPVALPPPIPDGEPLPGDAWAWAGATALNAVFLAQSWGLSVAPPFNPPYWSLNYEVWYYFLFGAWTFAPGRWRYGLLVLFALMAGPQILLLMPIWLMGVAIQRWRPRLTQAQARNLFLLSLVAALAWIWWDLSRALRGAAAAQWPKVWWSLRGANQFPGDFVLGLLIAAHFVAAAQLDDLQSILRPAQGLIRSLAAYTLSTYVFHMPLAALIWLASDLHPPLAFSFALFAGIVALGSLTEKQLPRARWLVDGLFTAAGWPLRRRLTAATGAASKAAGAR